MLDASRRADLGRILALDHGSKRIGLAISDALQLTAQPFDTWSANDPEIYDRLTELISAQEVERIIVGLPITLSGRESASAEAARRFAADVEAATGLEVELVDERFSTKIAERAMIEADVSRKGRRNKRDRVAAAVVLQGYLDAKNAE